MRIVSGRFFTGPNVHDDASGVVIDNELGSLPPAGRPFGDPREPAGRTLGALGIAGVAEGWAAVARQGRAALPGFLLRLAAALATPASISPSAGRIIGMSETRLVVFLRCEHEAIGLAAWDCACKAAMACLPGEGDGRLAALAAAHAAFRRTAKRLGPDLITAAFAREARRLDLPCYRLKIPGEHLQIGQGRHRRYLFEALSDGIGATSRLLSQDKFLTNRILGACGVPVLPMMEVHSEAGAVAAAGRLGYPVVVKPCHGGQGRGVAVHLTDPAQVAAAYRVAAAGPDSVVVEKFAAGHDHRVLVLDGRVIGVARRVPAAVVGDGRHSVAALVDRLNQDPRRGTGHASVLVGVEIDEGVVALLAEQGLTPDSIPPAGRIVALKRTANISTGGTAIDATDTIHPDNRAILERAATALELAIVGIDFLSDDITRSWREVGGVVLEMNAPPDLRPHWLAHPGHNVLTPILRSLLAPGSDGRIPTCAITGSVGKTTTANMVARILATTGLRVGRCTTFGVTVGDQQQRIYDCAGGWHARALLLDRRVEAGVFELARGALLNEGMTIEDCDVGAVLNVHDNHIGSDGIASRADLARIKAIVARRARRVLVLNGEDPLCLAMREVTRAARICLVGKDAASPALSDHIAAGGDAVVLRPSPEGGMIRLIDRGVAQDVLAPAEIPVSFNGIHGGKVWNAMFAAAIAHAMGASLDDLRQGLRTFKPDVGDAEGRLSVIDRFPFRLLLDLVTGEAPARELANLVRKTATPGRKRLYVTAPAEWPDAYIKAIGRALAGAFDVHVCANWTEGTRPDPQAIPGLLRDGLIEGGVAATAVTCIPSEDEALLRALAEADPGDLLVIASYDVEYALELIESFASA